MIRRIARSDLVLHGAIVFAGLIVANILNYLYFVLCGRILGVEAYGELTSLTAAVLVFSAPATVAQMIVARLVADEEAAGRVARRARVARAAVRATLWCALGVTVAGAALARPLADFLHIASVWPIVVSAASLGLYAVITVQRGALQGAHRFGQFSASYCVESVLRTGIGVALAPAYGALGALIGLLAGVAGCFVYDEIVLRAGGRPDAGGETSPGEIRVAYVAWRIGVAQLMLTVLSFYDVIVARHVFSTRDSGLYASAALAGRVMIGLLAFVPTIVLPKATSRASAGRSTAGLFAGALGIGAAIAVPGCLLAALFPERVVTLLAGRAFAAAAPIVPVYVAAAAALGLANVVAAYQFGLHRYRFVALSTCAGLLEIVVLCAWHPPPLAMAGVLLAGHACVLVTSFIGAGEGLRARRAVRALGILAAAFFLAGCGRHHERTIPEGIILPSAPPYVTVGGITTGGPVDPTCCWAGGDARFSLRKEQGATDLAVTIYIPSFETFAHSPQGIVAVVDGRRLADKCCFHEGVHTLLFPLPAEVRRRTGELAVELRARHTFVPLREHVGPESASFAYVLVSAAFGSFWSGRF